MREVASTYVVVPIDEAVLDFSGIMTLNGTGAFLWRQLEAGAAESELIAALLEEYDTDESTAQKDIAEFIAKLKSADLLE